MKLCSVDNCPVCGVGELLVAIDNSSEELLVICDECESQWLNPKDVLDGKESIDNESINLNFEITDEQIIDSQWGQYLKTMNP